MTSPLTDEQLSAIEARLAAATPGPWLYCGKGSEFYTPGPPPYTYGDFITQLSEHGAEKISEGNIELIEHAPADIAALLADNVRLRAEVARLKLAILKGVNQRHWGGCLHVMREALGDDEVNRMLNTVQP